MLGDASLPAVPDEIVVGPDEPESANSADEDNGSGPASGVESSDAGWTIAVAPCGEEDSASGLIAAEKDKAAVGAPEKIISRRRTLFLVKMPRSADIKLRNQIKLAELQLEEACKNRDFIRAALQLKRASKVDLLDKLKIVRDKDRACKEATQKKRMEIEPLQAALNRYKVAYTKNKEQEELNDRIAYMKHRIHHESIPLKEEKQLIMEIKKLESTRSQVCAKEGVQTGLVESLDPMEEIQEHSEILYQELKTLKNEQLHARAKCEPVERDLHNLNVIMNELVKQLENANRTQQEAFIACKDLKKLQGEQNAEFYKNKEDIRKAKELAFHRCLEDLEALCHEQVEGFLTQWNNDVSFREKYIKNNEQSTIRRLETLDGRSLGPDEEPILLMSDVDIMTGPVKDKDMVPGVGTQEKIATDIGHMKVSKALTDDAKQPARVDMATPAESLSQAAHNLSVSKGAEGKIAKTSKLSKPSTSSETTVEHDSAAFENAEMREAQAAELKDKRRQQEMAKAREAAERKKRQAERAQAKAALRAQREAERREKEREKKARKKSAHNLVDSNSSEVACQSEAREVAVATDELPKTSSEAVKESSPLKKKVTGRKPKVPRYPVVIPVPKKATWSFPTWLWVILAVILLSIFLALLNF